jgi:MinD superfamily P-loop ATPase
MLRQAPGIYEVCNTKMMGNLFLSLGIRQEHFIEEEMDVRKILIDRNRCPEDCAICNDFCPLGLDVPRQLTDDSAERCIKCLYCYMVCPNKAIELDGSFGFLQAQIDKYDPLIRRILSDVP